MKNILFTFFVFSITSSFAQTDCGTVVTTEQLNFMNSWKEEIDLSKTRTQASSVSVPVQFFLIRRSDGTGGMTESRAHTLLDEVNSIYSTADISFFHVSDPVFIDSDDFYNLDSSQENTLASSRDKSGVVNIYISSSLTSGGTPLCGYTRFPPSTDRVFVALPCADNEVGTTAHELGHYFTLFHTHGKTNTGTTDELVDGSNCTIAGDDICDTPADPNLSGVISGCAYTGTAEDANGDLYEPNPSNIMSYAPNGCRDLFTAGQYDRIRSGLDNGRSYLNLIFPNFTARLDVSARTGCSPSSFEFEDITNNAVSREWSFEGADIQTSAARIVKVTYDAPGRYDVSLTVTNANGQSSTTERNNFIVIRDPFENLIQEGTLNEFDEATLPAKWSIDNEDLLETFKFSNVSSDGSGNSIFINNYGYNAETIPQQDNLLLSSYDIKDLKGYSLSFDYAYTYRLVESDEDQYDSLIIGYLTDCSQDVNELIRVGGEDLNTANPTSSSFVPGIDDWKSFNYNVNIENISSFKDFQTIRPAIGNVCGNGNNLYLDNIKLVPDFSLDSLQFFRGGIENQSIILRWANFSINSRGIIVERSFDGENFDVIDTVTVNEFIDNTSDLLENNTVFYRVKSFNNIEQSSYSETIQISTVISGLNEEQNIVIYPNPVKNIVHFSLDNESGIKIDKIDVVSINGEVIIDVANPQEESILDLSKIDNGIYFVRFYTDKSVLRKKILKLE